MHGRSIDNTCITSFKICFQIIVLFSAVDKYTRGLKKSWIVGIYRFNYFFDSEIQVHVLRSTYCHLDLAGRVSSLIVVIIDSHPVVGHIHEALVAHAY